MASSRKVSVAPMPVFSFGPARAVFAVLMTLVLVLVTACTDTDTPRGRDSTTASAPAVTSIATSEDSEGTVTENGFELQLGPISAQGPAGVAPAGTAVLMRQVDAPSEVVDSGVTLAVPVFEIVFEDGLQPARPVQISLELESVPSPAVPLAFSTLNSETDRWEGLPVTLNGTTASVSLEHFSLGVFAWVGDLVVDAVAAIAEFAGMRFPEPDCVRTPVEVDGRRYRASVDTYDVHPCAEGAGGSAVLSVHSNSPFVWRVTAQEGATGREPETPMSMASLATTTAFSMMVGGDHSGQTVVVPGGSARLILDEGTFETTADLEISALLGVIAMALGMVDPLIGELPHVKVVELGKCLGGMWAATADPDFVQIVKSVADCGGIVLGRAAAFILSLIASVAPAIATLAATEITTIAGNGTAVARLESVLLQPPWTIEDSLLPPGTCSGWAGPDEAVQLQDGQGEARDANGDYAGISVMGIELIGTADVTGDGEEELVVSLVCSGSPIENCCAGGTSMVANVAALGRGADDQLTLVVPGLTGGESLPGNEYGPAQRLISTSELDGTTLVTTEYHPYPHLYTAEEVGGDPSAPVSARYTVQDGQWTPVPIP